MPFPAFSCCRCTLHSTFVCFHMFQRCILIVLILPFCYCYYPFNVDFFQELFGCYFTMKVDGVHVHKSQGKTLVPGP